jgi:hypothetical protein
MMTRHATPIAPLLILAFALGSHLLSAQTPGAQEARAAAESWLSLIDMQSYAASWDAAATIFKKAVAKEKWQASVQSVRGPLGHLKSRALKNTAATSALPGAPAGDYVVFQFDTSFQKKAAAVETVTAIREPDGTWHVGGYFIR